MLEGAEAGDPLSYPWYELRLARLAKAYRWVAARVAEAAARFTRQRGYPPPYWVLLDLSRIATEALRGAPRTAQL